MVSDFILQVTFKKHLWSSVVLLKNNIHNNLKRCLDINTPVFQLHTEKTCLWDLGFLHVLQTKHIKTKENYV